ncbi:DUF4430 domain-containing protein [Patescibacteria group bacterium]|nr:MAG: DUF4430 domain-containing protein [Patescibacteria group bacterium]
MKAKLAAAFIVVAAASFLLGWSFGPALSRVEGPVVNAPASETAAQSVSLMFDYGDGTVKTYENVAFTEGQTLFDATKTAIEGDGLTFKFQPPGPYGILIDQIGSMAGGTDGKYWLWYENNRMGQVASDAYKLQNGDVIEWKFINLKM